jgi:hypothetical protein
VSAFAWIELGLWEDTEHQNRLRGLQARVQVQVRYRKQSPDRTPTLVFARDSEAYQRRPEDNEIITREIRLLTGKEVRIAEWGPMGESGESFARVEVMP